MQAIQFMAFLITLGGALVSLIFGVIFHRKLAVQIASVFLIAVGFLVIIGYVADSPNIYTIPPTGIGMALPTGICFLITGACLLVLVNEVKFMDKEDDEDD